MNNGVSQESSVLLDLASHVNRFAFDSFRSDNNKTLLSNFLHFNGNTRTGAAAAKRGVSLGGKVGGASVRFGNILNDFNRAVRFHCEKIPIGFASLRVGDGGDGADGNGNGEGNGVRVDECGGVENEGFRGNGVDSCILFLGIKELINSTTFSFGWGGRWSRDFMKIALKKIGKALF